MSRKTSNKYASKKKEPIKIVYKNDKGKMNWVFKNTFLPDHLSTFGVLYRDLESGTEMKRYKKLSTIEKYMKSRGYNEIRRDYPKEED